MWCSMGNLALPLAVCLLSVQPYYRTSLAFQVAHQLHAPITTRRLSEQSPCRISTVLHESTMPLGDDGEDEDEVEPGKMRVSEIKAELDLRGVTYGDCFDKESLSQRLLQARSSGKANPEILDKFNKAKLEQTFKEEKLEIKDEDLEKAVASDGKLPGGMDPETFKKLIGNPEVMALLQSPKMQEAMELMMTGGQGELERRMGEDRELQEVVQKLGGVMKKL